MARHIEESLDMKLGEAIPLMQEEITQRTSWFGVRALKAPVDAWVYQEILWETRPDVIVEIGLMFGGSTLYLAHLCDLMGRGRVIGIDLAVDRVPPSVREHPRVKLLAGDACALFADVRKMISKEERVLVIEDSSHTHANTLNLLRVYSPLVKVGDYFIVEDGICRHGLPKGPQPGPYEAVEDFLREDPDFECDRTRERFILTWNPKGYLKRARLTVGTSSAPLLPETWAEPEVPPEPQVRFRVLRHVVKLFLPPIFVLFYQKLRPRREAKPKP